MTCEKFAGMLDNYETLTDEEKALMDEHAQKCEACRRELDFMRSVINAVKTLPEIKVPDDFLDNLNRRIDAEEITVNRRGIADYLRYGWKKYSAVAACLVLAAVIGANYNTLIDRMNKDDDGVISTVTAVSSPVPGDDSDNAPVSTAAADLPAADESTKADGSTVAADNADNKSEKSSSGTNRRKTVTESRVSTGVRGENTARQSEASQRTEAAVQTAETSLTEQDEVAPETAPEISKPENGGVETMTIPRNVYVESRGARSVEPTMDTGAQDNPYEINAMSETGGYAVARTGDSVAENGDSTARIYGSAGSPDNVDNDEAADDGPGYELNQSNKLIVNGEDFATAFDIISRYVSDSYGNYFMVTAGKLDAMLSALDEAGVRYRSIIGFNSDKITFRISIE